MMKSTYVNLRGRAFKLIGGSMLPRRMRITLDATGPSRWVRLGLLPGLGSFRNNATLLSFGSVIWVKAPESRTAAIQRLPMIGSTRESAFETEDTTVDRGHSVSWGLMSTARINQALISPIRASSRSRLLAVASRDAERARQYAKAWKIPRYFGSYEAMLEEDELDIVYISLPNHLHVEWTIRALEAGKHVLCEKPIALTPADVDRIAEAVDRTGRVASEAFMYRHHARTHRAKQLIDAGRIGSVRHVEGAFTYNLNQPNNIRLDPDMGGGSLWDVGCYPVSFARYLLASEPVEVVGHQVLGPDDVDLQFAGQLLFPKDITFQFSSAFNSAPRMEMRVVGSQGVLELPQAFKPGASSEILLHTDQGTERISVQGHPLYFDEVEDMVDAVLTGRPSRVSLAESRGNVTTIEALFRSAKDGVPVPLGQSQPEQPDFDG